MTLSNLILTSIYVITCISILYLRGYLRIFLISAYSFIFLNYSEFSRIAFNVNSGMLSTDLDLNVYSRMIHGVCNGEISSDFFFNLISPFFCEFSSFLVIKILVFTNILFQIILISRIFENRKNATFIFFAFGSFYWSNFNTLTASLSVTFFMISIALFKNNKLLFLGSGILNALAVHTTTLPIYLTLIASKFKKIFFLATLLLIYFFIIFFSPIFFNLFTEFDDRFASYFNIDDGISFNSTLFVFLIFLYYVIFKCYKKISPFSSLHFYVFLTILFLLFIDLTIKIQNDIISRLTSPLLFISLYETLNSIDMHIKNLFARLFFIVFAIIFTLGSLINTNNGWSFLGGF